MNHKGQGAIEYLLIIGAAILVVAIVIVAITSVVNTGKNSSAGTDENKQANALKCQVDLNYFGTAAGGSCAIWDNNGKAKSKTTCNCCTDSINIATGQVGACQ